MKSFPESQLGIQNRIGRMKTLAARMRAAYATNDRCNGIDQDDANALAELVEIFFRDDLNKLTENK